MNILKNIKFNKYIVLLFLIIIPVFTYLSIKAMQVDSWDDWGFGSAQIMLGVRYWARDGIVNHKFFLLPSGYNEDIKFLDQPEFQFLADGIATGELIGRRLYYAHYPSGYLISSGILAKIGFNDRYWFRMLALLLSFGAIFFIYGFIYLVTNKKHWPALIAVFYYLTSTTFLRYADSLSNQPIDDLLKWAILFFSIYAADFTSEIKLKKKLIILIWLLYFILASSSYDSTFFVFFWLCALTYYNNLKIEKPWFKQFFTKVNIKKYFIWASAPILAFSLQIAQNMWYLGFKDMVLDFWGAFVFRSTETMGSANSLPFFVKSFIVALANIGYFTDLRTRFALPLFIFILFFIYKSNIVANYKKLYYYVSFLALGGFLIGFILPGAGVFGYQGRQLAPALLIIISIITYKIFTALKEKNINFNYLFLSLLIIIIWLAHFNACYIYVKKWPNNVVSIDAINYWRELNNITSKNTIILTLQDVEEINHGKFIPQFYADRLILFFSDIDNLLHYMNKISKSIKKTDFLLVVHADDTDLVKKFIIENQDYFAQKINIEKNNLIHFKIKANEF